MHSVLSSATLILSVLATSTLANPQYGDSDPTTTSSTASATAAASTAGIHQVTVGPALKFTPDTVTAAVGDMIEFTFNAGHSVAQSDFANPCTPLSGGTGVYSGFPNQGDVWHFQVNSTDPLWMYCSFTGHCQAGMAMVVNPPSSGNTLDAYISAAANSQGTSPETVQGGIFGAAAAPSGSSSSSASGSSTASATASATAGSGNGASGSVLSTGLLVAGAVAAGVAAVL